MSLPYSCFQSPPSYFPLSDPLRRLQCPDSRNFTETSVSDSLNCNLWCLQILDIHLGCKLHGKGIKAPLLCMVLPQPLIESEVKRKSQGSTPRLRLSIINLFSDILSRTHIEFWEDIDLKNPLCSNWLSQ